MKKTKIIAAVLCVAVMLMGAGYAYWQDAITITNTVSTGEFNVEFVNQGGYPKSSGIYESYKKNNPGQGEGNGQYDWVKNNTYAQARVEHGAKDTKIVLTDMYPGTYAKIDMLVKNKGTIPAVFDKVTVSFTNENDPKVIAMKDTLMVSLGVTKYKANGEAYKANETDKHNKLKAEIKLKDLEKELKALLSGLRLEPNEAITFDIPEEFYEQAMLEVPGFDVNGDECITFHLPYSATETVEKATAEFTVKIDWKQHNAQ